MRPKSESLFHFTRRMDTLKSILQHGFYPFVSREDISWAGDVRDNYLGIHMVCFCDIPLGRITEHVDFYGHYGLGMARQWAIHSHLNPVFYVVPGGPVSECIKTVLAMPDDVELFRVSFGEEPGDVHHAVMRLVAYVKPTEGVMPVLGKNESKQFYQENEWRFIPFSEHKFIEIYTEERLEKPETKRHIEFMATRHPLLFHASDLRYLFVERDEEVPDLVEFVLNGLDRIPQNERLQIVTRITSLESLKSDF